MDNADSQQAGSCPSSEPGAEILLLWLPAEREPKARVMVKGYAEAIANAGRARAEGPSDGEVVRQGFALWTRRSRGH